jgi:hypothetical protein
MNVSEPKSTPKGQSDNLTSIIAYRSRPPPRNVTCSRKPFCTVSKTDVLGADLLLLAEAPSCTEVLSFSLWVCSRNWRVFGKGWFLEEGEIVRMDHRSDINAYWSPRYSFNHHPPPTPVGHKITKYTLRWAGLSRCGWQDYIHNSNGFISLSGVATATNKTFWTQTAYWLLALATAWHNVNT